MPPYQCPPNDEVDQQTNGLMDLNVISLDHPRPRPHLKPGVYVPTVCFFDKGTEHLDTAAMTHHAQNLARAGVAGIATQGSNGEAVHLTHAERRLVTYTTRKALDTAGYPHLPLIVGCGCQSTRETIACCREAWSAGGDVALVLPPSYYSGIFAPSSETVLSYFTAVADASPIPVLIYNYPGGANGLDLSSDLVIALSKHPNIVGVKLTCGNTGKLARIVAGTQGEKPKEASDSPGFLVLGGSADFTVQSLAAGGHGILAGLANLAPRVCIRTMQLFQQGDLETARTMQATLAQGDWIAMQNGVVGVKAGMQAWLGYGGFARHPLPQPTKEDLVKWKDDYRELMLLETSLEPETKE